MNALLLSLALVGTTPRTVIVFDVEDAAPGGTPARAQALHQIVKDAILSDRRFQLVAESDVLMAIRRTGRRRCSFPLCQSEVVRALATDLGVALQLFRADSQCAAALRFFDGLTRDVGKVSVRLGPCEEVETLVERAVMGRLGTRRVRPRRAGDAGRDSDPQKKAREMALSAETAIAEGRLEDAKARLRDCLETHELPRCHRDLGVLEAKLNHPDEALRHYRRYLRLAPNSPDASEVRSIVEAAGPGKGD